MVLYKKNFHPQIFEHFIKIYLELENFQQQKNALYHNVREIFNKEQGVFNKYKKNVTSCFDTFLGDFTSVQSNIQHSLSLLSLLKMQQMQPLVIPHLLLNSLNFHAQNAFPNHQLHPSHPLHLAHGFPPINLNHMPPNPMTGQNFFPMHPSNIPIPQSLRDHMHMQQQQKPPIQTFNLETTTTDEKMQKSLDDLKEKEVDIYVKEIKEIKENKEVVKEVKEDPIQFKNRQRKRD